MATQEKHKTPLAVRFSFFMILVTALVFLPSTIILFVCMIPTLVAMVIDKHPQKTAWLTVGGMNLAGTIPAWMTLFDMGHTTPAAFQLIAEPMTVIMSYGGAAVGWLLYHNITPVVAGIILGRNERRLKAIDLRQKELVKKWGSEVTAA